MAETKMMVIVNQLQVLARTAETIEQKRIYNALCDDLLAYAEIEEELDIDLPIFFKALKKGGIIK